VCKKGKKCVMKKYDTVVSLCKGKKVMCKYTCVLVVPEATKSILFLK